MGMKRIHLHVEQLRMTGIPHAAGPAALDSLKRRLIHEFSRPQLLQDVLARKADFVTTLGRVSAPRMDATGRRQTRSRT
jgi:hypothetical protein